MPIVLNAKHRVDDDNQFILNVFSTDDEEQGIFTAAVQSALPGVKFIVHSSLEAALAGIEAQKGKILCPIVAPRDALTKRLAAGAEPPQALADWIEAAQQQMIPFRKARRHVAMMSVYAAAQDPVACLAALIGAEGHPETPKDHDTSLNLILPVQSAADVLIAQSLINASDAAAALAGEIEAMLAAPIAAPFVPTEVIQAAWHELKQEARAQSLSEECATLREALDDATSQAGDVQVAVEALAAETLKHEVLMSEIAALKDENLEIADKMALLSKAATEAAAATVEQQQLLTQSRQEATGLQEQVAHLSQVEAQRDEAQAAQARAYHNQAEEVTLLRSVLDSLQHASEDLSAHTEESAQSANLQLNAEQKRREEADNLLRQMQAQRDERGRVAAAVAGELAARSQELDDVKRAYTQALEDLGMLSSALSEVYASNSWKITGPIRSIVNRFRK